MSKCDRRSCPNEATVVDGEYRWCAECHANVSRQIAEAMQLVDFAKGLERRMEARN